MNQNASLQKLQQTFMVEIMERNRSGLRFGISYFGGSFWHSLCTSIVFAICRGSTIQYLTLLCRISLRHFKNRKLIKENKVPPSWLLFCIVVLVMLLEIETNPGVCVCVYVCGGGRMGKGKERERGGGNLTRVI